MAKQVSLLTRMESRLKDTCWIPLWTQLACHTLMQSPSTCQSFPTSVLALSAHTLRKFTHLGRPNHVRNHRDPTSELLWAFLTTVSIFSDVSHHIRPVVAEYHDAKSSPAPRLPLVPCHVVRRWTVSISHVLTEMRTTDGWLDVSQIRNGELFMLVL